jgi:hypothetical protein
MENKNDKVIRHLERCFAKTTRMGMPLIERYITDEEKAFGERLMATYNRTRTND